MKKLNGTQKLEALQAVVNNPSIDFYDIPYYALTFRIIDWDVKHSSLTKEGRVIWEQFTTHLNAGYKKLTKNELLFWLTKYTGNHQPTSQQLFDIACKTKSTEIFTAVIAYYANHHGKNGMTDEWRATLTDFFSSCYSKQTAIEIAPIIDEQLIRNTWDNKMIAAWLKDHPQASAAIIHR